VALHNYQAMDWSEIIEGWRVMNQQLTRAASIISPQTSDRKLMAGGNPVTLGFLVDDYVDHLLHHLRHIGIDFDVGDARNPSSPGARA
jgi:hypothetical protein